MASDDQAPSVERKWPGWLPFAVSAGVALLFLFLLPPLSKSGLWDPYELNVADLSRRIALTLYHAPLELAGADNSLPHLNDLGRPQLPFSSVALGFKLFGLHEWAGRAPLALWGLLGVLATFAFVSRLFDRRTGTYAAVALTTMPLYFVQARSMLGDVSIMAGLAMSFGGLAVAVFDRDERGPTGFGRRLPWLLLCAIGLFVGFESRGGILGLSVPLLSVGVTWALARLGSSRSADAAGVTSSPDHLGDLLGAMAVLAGAVVLVKGVVAMGGDKPPKDLSLWVGAMVHTPAKYPTYDFYLASIGHALAPWSAFLPFALGRLFVAPIGRSGPLLQRESLGRVAILVGLAVAFGAHGFLAAKTDLIAFAGPALAAAACAVAIRDFERGAHSSVAVGVGTLVLAGVFHHDFHELPEKAYQAFAVVGAAFPESFKNHALVLWTVVLVGFALVAFLTWAEKDSSRTPFDPRTYFNVLKALREAWDGLLALGFFATVAGASLAGLFVWVGARTHASWMPQMSIQIRDGVLNAWWFIAFVPLGSVLGIVYACDVWLWAFNRSRPFGFTSLTRGFEPFEQLVKRLSEARAVDASLSETEQEERRALLVTSALVLVPFMVLLVPVGTFLALYSGGVRPIAAALLGVPSGVAFFLVLGIVGDLLRHRAPGLALGGAVVGFILCFFYYPALANQLSPKEVFESYQHIHSDGEPLALLGVGGKTSAYYAGGAPEQLHDPQSAYNWLVGGEGKRRFLAMKSDDLAKLNQIYREHAQPRINLPVLDSRSSQILLAASSLLSGEKDQNPLDTVVLADAPHPQRRIDANMEDKLEVIGIDIIDPGAGGKRVDSVAPGRPYHMRTYYRVLAPITTEWEAFIHIDGYRRRHNGDHKPMDGKYPMALWLVGDLLVDEYEFKLEPNFTPGNYTIYFGLFVGDTRLKVKSGPNDGDNRINGGQLRVQ